MEKRNNIIKNKFHQTCKYYIYKNLYLKKISLSGSLAPPHFAHLMSEYIKNMIIIIIYN